MAEPKNSELQPIDEAIRLLKKISANTGQTRQYAAKMFYLVAIAVAVLVIATIGSCAR